MPLEVDIDWSQMPPEGREASLPIAHLAALEHAIEILALPVTHIRLIASPLGRYALVGQTLEATFDPVLPPPTAGELIGLLAAIA
jgi:hypothetical protein